MMYYLMEEAQEGKRAFLEKRDPDFDKFPKFPQSFQNMLKASYTKYSLHFKEPVGTSRGVMRDKVTYFIRIWNDANPAVIRVGE